MSSSRDWRLRIEDMLEAIKPSAQVRLFGRATLLAGAAVLAALLAGCSSGAARSRSAKAASATVFTATGVEDADRDGSIGPREWHQKVIFGRDEPLVLVIDDPQAGRDLRLKLIGNNRKEYDFPTPIHTPKDAYQPLAWARASEARECVDSDIIMAELYDVATGELVGSCAFSVEDIPAVP